MTQECLCKLREIFQYPKIRFIGQPLKGHFDWRVHFLLLPY